MSRSITRISILISLSLSLTACATYQPSEAECFNSFAEVARSNCSFDLLRTIAPSGAHNG
jgi:hypothetical protein